MSGELEMARESYAVAYVTAVCATTVLYDYCLTVGEEIRRMWPARISIPKILFLLDRYVVLPMLVFNGIEIIFHLPCVFYLRWLVVVITITNTVVEGILLSRVVALYRDNKVVIAVACFLYAGGVISQIGFTVKDYVGEAVNIVEDFSALPGCYAASVPKLIAGYWIAPTIIESTFFGLVVWRVIVWSRDNIGVPAALVLMARDSTLYFAVVFVLLIVNLLVFYCAPPFLSSLFVTPVNTAGCIAGSRMLMNLRGLRHTDSDTEIEMTHVTALRFGSRLWDKGRKSMGLSSMTTSTATSDWTRSTLSTNDELATRLGQRSAPVVPYARPTDTQALGFASDTV